MQKWSSTKADENLKGDLLGLSDLIDGLLVSIVGSHVRANYGGVR